MFVTFEKIQCWSPQSSFNVFLEKSAPLDLATFQSATPKYVQVGPYRIKIEVEGPGNSISSLKIGTAGAKIKNVAAAGSVSGSVFCFTQDGVEMVSSDGNFTVLGSASGCFEVHW